MLGAVDQDEIGGAALLNQPAVEFAHPGGVPGRKAERDLGRRVAERRQHRHHPQDSERLNPGARGPVGAEDDAVELVQLARGAEREQGRGLVAVMDDLDPGLALLAEAGDLVARQRGVPAVYVADDVGPGLQHDVGVDQPGAGDRGTAGVDRRLDAVFARPADHLLRLLAGLDAAEADLAQQLDSGLGEEPEIVLLHSGLEDRRAGVDLDPAGRKGREGALRGDPERHHALRIARASGEVDLAGGDHRRHPAMHRGVDPVELALAGRPVAEHRMDVAVDQPGRERDPLGVDYDIRPGGVAVGLLAEGGDLSVLGDHGVGVEDGVFQRPGQEQADIPDDQLFSHGARPRIGFPKARTSPKGRAGSRPAADGKERCGAAYSPAAASGAAPSSAAIRLSMMRRAWMPPPSWLISTRARSGAVLMLSCWSWMISRSSRKAVCTFS